eukprot:CAMPEP_0181100288 /NCGR_PEP_ID=MMETSP1071-20121207/13114_1 /TAXON_ID=35127 /ORGANISM="Thalassiosira sp., Strain NH16" /LENGTH=161 /DNA_ID=CAMNT_0023183009 /DNA_START=493 /DNA_END=978 /DNA_ORIENTATION=+
MESSWQGKFIVMVHDLSSTQRATGRGAKLAEEITNCITKARHQGSRIGGCTNNSAHVSQCISTKRQQQGDQRRRRRGRPGFNLAIVILQWRNERLPQDADPAPPPQHLLASLRISSSTIPSSRSMSNTFRSLSFHGRPLDAPGPYFLGGVAFLACPIRLDS